MITFHNEPRLKDAILSRLREHRRLDHVAQGTYSCDVGGNWKGCHWGCIAHDTKGNQTIGRRPDTGRWDFMPTLFGLTVQLGNLLEVHFEALSSRAARTWVVDSIAAIPVGADPSRVWQEYAAWVLADERWGVSQYTLPRSRQCLHNVVAKLKLPAMLASEDLLTLQLMVGFANEASAGYGRACADSTAGDAAISTFASVVAAFTFAPAVQSAVFLARHVHFLADGRDRSKAFVQASRDKLLQIFRDLSIIGCESCDEQADEALRQFSTVLVEV